MTDAPVVKRPIGFAVYLIIAGAIGWYAAFQLTVEKFTNLEHPAVKLACDISPLVQCSKNLDSWQGSLLGFPNPILGLSGWVAPIAVGIALLAGARFKPWFWWLFNVGVAFGLALVIFLIGTSLFSIHTLCPWCMLTWFVTIPTFWLVTLRNVSRLALKQPRTPGMLVALAAGLSIICYLVVIAFAQSEFDLLQYI